MADYSDRSLELAHELRATALRNLGRSSTYYRSAITGRFVSSPPAQAHPRTTRAENGGGTAST